MTTTMHQTTIHFHLPHVPVLSLPRSTNNSTMKLLILSIAAGLLSSQTVSGFAPRVIPGCTAVTLKAAVELKPEPEGGEELTAVKTMAGSKMKNMGAAEKAKSDDGTVYKFWLQATAHGPLIKELNTQVLKDAAKKANFPGFRKVGWIGIFHG